MSRRQKFSIALGVGVIAIGLLSASRSFGVLDQADRLFYGMAAFAYLLGVFAGAWATTASEQKAQAQSMIRKNGKVGNETHEQERRASPSVASSK